MTTPHDAGPVAENRTGAAQPGERRRRARQQVELPLAILRIAGERIERHETTRDISSGGGVSFRSTQPLSVGDAVEYTIVLSGGNAPITIYCCGKVNRCTRDRAGDSATLDIAMTMERYRFMLEQ
jgi:PilZ domain-containing protein